MSKSNEFEYIVSFDGKDISTIEEERKILDTLSNLVENPNITTEQWDKLRNWQANCGLNRGANLLCLAAENPHNPDDLNDYTENYTKLALALIEKKFDVNSGSYKPLFLACDNGNVELVKALLNTKADPSIVCLKAGVTYEEGNQKEIFHLLEEAYRNKGLPKAVLYDSTASSDPRARAGEHERKFMDYQDKNDSPEVQHDKWVRFAMDHPLRGGDDCRIC